MLKELSALNTMQSLRDAVSSSQSSAGLVTAQVGKAEFDNDKTCGKQGCNNNGICFNKTCYCDKYHSGEKCEKDLAHPGVKGPISFVFYGVALVLGLVTGAFVAKIYNENHKKLFL